MRKAIVMLCMVSSLLITACASSEIYSGTATELQQEQVIGEVGKDAEIEWFNGIEKEKLTTTVASLAIKNEAINEMMKHDLSLVKAQDNAADNKSSYYWVCFQIKESEGRIPVVIRSEDGKQLSLNGFQYKGDSYYIGDDWYCASIPNGLTKFMIKAGDTGFLYQESAEPVEETKNNI